MQYLLMLYDNEKAFAEIPQEEQGRIFGEYMTFTQEIRASGHLRGGDALEPVSTATCVRTRGGKTTRTDGPFAETREQLGGYYLIEAKDLDEACAIAARIPAARTGTVEVRPIMVLPEG